MSAKVLEKMENRYYEETKQFQQECIKRNPDFSMLEELLAKGVDINSVSKDPADSRSILANVIMDFWFEYDCEQKEKDPFGCDEICDLCEYSEHSEQEAGETLYKLIGFFIDHGFDVSRFGAECIEALCYSTYDNWVLMSAELLIDHGADLSEEDEDGDNTLDAVCWKMGDWHTGQFRSANLFCALAEMVEAAMNGEDYHGIRDFDICIGKTVTKIEKIVGDEAPEIVRTEKHGRFHSGLIIWCEDVPLYVNKCPEVYVSPLAVRKADKVQDITDQYEEIKEAVVESLYFVDDCTAMICFRGMRERLVLGYCQQENYEDSYGYLCIARETRASALMEGRIAQILFKAGRRYSGTATRYEEELALLKMSTGLYMLFSEGEHYRKHKMKLYKVCEYARNGKHRELRYHDIRVNKLLYEEDGTWRGLILAADDLYLTLHTDIFEKMAMGAAKKPIEKLPSIDRKELVHLTFKEVKY